ncbi:MAG TPA: antibiotic biosynthesis monooxygenase family protein [Candidatus Binatus sp.]|jgi:heme-degrading monooxygenase HmoA|nr:antibiotic biosynthesis monooxygenase family protein [Candidatus Binatus sp.]
MHARVTQFSIPSEKLSEFREALNSAIPLMRQREGFQALLVLRVEQSNPPDVRVMTLWETQEALHKSENSLMFYQALARALAFAKGFPVMREEEVMLYDFGKAAAASAASS